MRRLQTEDWLEDLAEFGPAVVADACREWRRTGHRRPLPSDIRALCVAEQQARREHRLAIADHRAAWPPWLAELWGPAPEGPRLRAQAMQRSHAIRDSEPREPAE